MTQKECLKLLATYSELFVEIADFSYTTCIRYLYVGPTALEFHHDL